IWNAARFMFMNVDRVQAAGLWSHEGYESDMREAFVGFYALRLEDAWISSRFHRVAEEVGDALENYRFHEAANRIYDFLWGDVCDWYIELIKPRLIFEEGKSGETVRAACSNLVILFENSLRLLHPFMPFITEEIWQSIYSGKPPVKSIALATYPQADKTQI